MDNMSTVKHPLVFSAGILGFKGYKEMRLFCVLANGDNNFLRHGIAEGSLLVVDQGKRYQRGKLNVFRTSLIVDDLPQLKLSKTEIKDAEFVGRVIMSINQYD